MTDRFVTVPDSLELPPAVKVPVARLVGPTGAAATPADLGAAPIVHTHQQGDILGLVDVLGTKADLVNGVIPTSQIPREAAGASSAITVDDTPAVPAEGESASYFVTSAVVWPAGLEWSTDPDGGTAPTITGTALVSMFTVGGVTRAIMGATFPALPDTVAPDTVAPVAGTLASSSVTETGFTLTVTGASDVGGLHAQPYCFDSGAGTFGAWQTPAALAVTGKTAGTAYTARHKVRDAAGNETTGTSIIVTTVGADTTAPVWTATLTPGTPTETSVVVAASALATDNVGVTGYEVSYDNGSTYKAIVPSGSNFTLAGSAGVTYATTKLRAKDAAGNYSTALSVPSYTMAASTDTTAPTVGTMAASSITSSGFKLTVSGASDETALHAQPYDFEIAGTWAGYQASPVYVASGKTAETGYACNWRVRDAAGNVSTGTAQTVTTGAAATGLAGAILALSPAGYWKLDETSGTTAVDYSGNSRDGTYAGTYTLAGQDGYLATTGAATITIPDADAFSALPALTIFAVYRSTNNTGRIADKTGAQYEYKLGFASAGRLELAVWSTNGDNTPAFVRGSSAATHPTPSWNTAAGTISDPQQQTSTLHRGGATETPDRTAAGSKTYGNTTMPLTLARNLTGSLAHVAIFPAALTAGQIASLHAAAVSDPTVPVA